jgi:preprotein translocase SecE subunit
VANKMADKKKNASQSSQVAQSQMAEPKAKGVEREKEQSKTVKAAARDRGRDERKEPAKRRETKSSSTMQSSLRRNKYVRFILEAYYELRHKVTWPTFEEARNMTVVVIVLSVVIGIILGIADFGLLHLYKLIAGS